jgi:hypothetical protein
MEQQIIEVKALNMQFMDVNIHSLTPIIFNKFSRKSLELMLKTQTLTKAEIKLLKAKPRVWNEESKVEDATDKLHMTEDNVIGFPIIGIAASISCDAPNMGLFKKDVNSAMKFYNQDLSMDGEIIAVFEYNNKDIHLRVDRVRLSNGSTSATARYMLMKWSTTLKIGFDANILSAESVINLINNAGTHIGIGSWRPYVERGSGKPGIFGQYAVVNKPI